MEIRQPKTNSSKQRTTLLILFIALLIHQMQAQYYYTQKFSSEQGIKKGDIQNKLAIDGDHTAYAIIYEGGSEWKMMNWNITGTSDDQLQDSEKFERNGIEDHFVIVAGSYIIGGTNGNIRVFNANMYDFGQIFLPSVLIKKAYLSVKSTFVYLDNMGNLTEVNLSLIPIVIISLTNLTTSLIDDSCQNLLIMNSKKNRLVYFKSSQKKVKIRNIMNWDIEGEITLSYTPNTSAFIFNDTILAISEQNRIQFYRASSPYDYLHQVNVSQPFTHMTYDAFSEALVMRGTNNFLFALGLVELIESPMQDYDPFLLINLEGFSNGQLIAAGSSNKDEIYLLKNNYTSPDICPPRQYFDTACQPCSQFCVNCTNNLTCTCFAGLQNLCIEIEEDICATTVQNSRILCSEVIIDPVIRQVVNSAKSVVKVPLIRHVGGFMSYFFYINDQYFYYFYHKRNYTKMEMTSTFLFLLNEVNKDRLSVFSFTKDYHKYVNLSHIFTTNFSKYTRQNQYISKISSVHFVRNIQQYIVWTIAITLITAAFIRLFAIAIKRYVKSQRNSDSYRKLTLFYLFLRNTSSKYSIIVMLLQANLIVLTFEAFRQLKVPIAFSSLDKVNFFAAVMFLYFCLMYALAFYPIAYSFDKRQTLDLMQFDEDQIFSYFGEHTREILKFFFMGIANAAFLHDYLTLLSFLLAIRVIYLFFVIQSRKLQKNIFKYVLTIILAIVGIYYDVLLMVSYFVFEKGYKNFFMNLFVSYNDYQEISLIVLIIFLSLFIILIKLYEAIKGLCTKILTNKVGNLNKIDKNIDQSNAFPKQLCQEKQLDFDAQVQNLKKKHKVNFIVVQDKVVKDKDDKDVIKSTIVGVSIKKEKDTSQIPSILKHKSKIKKAKQFKDQYLKIAKKYKNIFQEQEKQQ